MPETGENVARECGVERIAQDAFALRSQMRAAQAMKDGFFAEEIVPVEVAGKKEKSIVAQMSIHGPIRLWRSWLRSSRFSRGDSDCGECFWRE